MRLPGISAFLLLLCPASLVLRAQEADSGFDLRATVSVTGENSNVLTSAPRFGSGFAGGFRAVLYPTLKLSEHWAISGAFQAESRPYSYESFSTQGYGFSGKLLQANLSWSNFWHEGSVIVRAGELSTAFGSFPLHYDDADNPLIDAPLEYGYYYKPVSFYPVAGVEIDVTRKKWDARAQFANSSPANPRSILSGDQYGNWAGGLGFSPRQGFRIGVSGYRGPYLDRQYAYYYPGEAEPSVLPARALGIDVEWATGHWNIQGELQKFLFSYRAIPAFRERAGYLEVKRVLHPRWYVAVRGGYLSAPATTLSLETTAGFRPSSHELIKFGYEVEHYETGELDRTIAIQLVTSIHPVSLARY